MVFPRFGGHIDLPTWGKSRVPQQPTLGASDETRLSAAVSSQSPSTNGRCRASRPASWTSPRRRSQGNLDCGARHRGQHTALPGHRSILRTEIVPALASERSSRMWRRGAARVPTVVIAALGRASCETAREPMNERQHSEREVRPKVTAVSAQQAESFAILRRPQAEGDRMPESRRTAFAGGMIGRLGLNPALARRAMTQLGEVWVVPGNGYIALDVGGMGCDRTEVAASRGMVTWTSASGGLQDLVHGLVPDGVEEVTLLAVNNASTTVIVNENVYGAILHGRFRSVRFFGPTGAVEFRL